MLVWPITIVLLLPIIAVEASYSRSRLGISRGQAFRVFGIANLVSTVIGFPIAAAVAAAIQNKMQVWLFGTRQANWERFSGGDVSRLALGMGQYPRWILIAAAAVMFVLCFAFSWWIEGAYIKWWLKRKGLATAATSSKTSQVVRDANLLSYMMLAAISLFALAWI